MQTDRGLWMRFVCSSMAPLPNREATYGIQVEPHSIIYGSTPSPVPKAMAWLHRLAAPSLSGVDGRRAKLFLIFHSKLVQTQTKTRSNSGSEKSRSPLEVREGHSALFMLPDLYPWLKAFHRLAQQGNRYASFSIRGPNGYVSFSNFSLTAIRLDL